MSSLDFSKLKEDFLAECLRVNDAEASLQEQEVESLRVAWLGRKGKVSSLFASLRDVAKEDKASYGKHLNDLKQCIESELAKLSSALKAKAVERMIRSEPVDITLPVAGEELAAGLHPITLVTDKLLSIFRSLGYVVSEGPELENDFYNFSALNVGKDHPARDMQDTFYVRSCGTAASSRVSESTSDSVLDSTEDTWVLRTQTSNIQIHMLKDQKPPLRMVSAGRVFRMDNDPTHSPMFHQIEGLVVDYGVSMADLKGTIKRFLSLLFDREVEIRFRPSYFPFVEPGVEVDMAYSDSNSQQKWLEVGGCGMVHPNVFENVGVNSEEYTGFAFGFGLDRLAMLIYQLTDLRAFFVGDKEFHSQFPVFSR